MAERLHAHASLCVRVRMRGLSALAHILSLVFSELSVSTSACSRSAKDVPSGVGRDETDSPCAHRCYPDYRYQYPWRHYS